MADGLSPQQAKRQADLYAQRWGETMAQIWRERIARLRVLDTGALYRSITQLTTTGEPTTIELRFLQYGMHVANGVGRNFLRSKQAGGTIPFLLPGGEQYRADNRLDRPRPIGPAWHRSHNSKGRAAKREAGGRPVNWNPRTRKYTGRDWYSRALYSSRMALGEAMRDIYADAYMGTFAQLTGGPMPITL